MNILPYIKYCNKNYGFKITMTDVLKVYDRKVLSISADFKTSKGEKYGYLTGILYLAPSDIVGFNVCPFASEGCRKACLNTAGRGTFNSVKLARILKTLAFLYDKDRFEVTLKRSINALLTKAINKGFKPVIRLNGTSDLRFESVYPWLHLSYGEIQFYDYTKYPLSVLTKKPLPDNYHITYSLSEKDSSYSQAIEYLRAGHNVAIVFKDKLPDTYFGFNVVNGDDSDLRFLDPKGSIIGLTAKGKAKKDTSGFVKTA